MTVIGRALDAEPRRWDSDLMTQAAKKLLEEFDALQEGDRAEVLAEVLGALPWLRTTCRILTTSCQPRIRSSWSSIGASNRSESATAGRGLAGRLGLAAKVRPAVVMSIPAADVDRALVTLVPHTTSARGSRFEAAVSVPFLRAGVFDAQIS
jgi:hypothetical protein